MHKYLHNQYTKRKYNELHHFVNINTSICCSSYFSIVIFSVHHLGGAILICFFNANSSNPKFEHALEPLHIRCQNLNLTVVLIVLGCCQAQCWILSWDIFLGYAGYCWMCSCCTFVIINNSMADKISKTTYENVHIPNENPSISTLLDQRYL